MPRGYPNNEHNVTFDPIRYAKDNYPDDPAKFLARYYDRRVVQNGGESIFALKHAIVYIGHKDDW